MTFKRKSVYIVKGRGRFPMDMLRYDMAHPMREGDARIIFLSCRGYAEDAQEVWEVMLESYHTPTRDRWSSFGWSVTYHELRQI